MTADGPNSTWADPVTEFLEDALPVTHGEGRNGWEHQFTSAWQFGCMALIAIGKATETKWGAAKRIPAQPPKRLPRWDDICCVVLAVLRQLRELEFRKLDGARYSPRQSASWQVSPTPSVPDANIFAAHGSGPAFASARGVALLEHLGLVAGGGWTDLAETVLWRMRPAAWDIGFDTAPRFEQAVRKADASMPDEIAVAFAQRVTISDTDIEASERLRKVAEAELRALYPNAKAAPISSIDAGRRSLAFRQQGDLDWLFFRNWRFADGWLPEADKERALDIFHDQLAQAVCRAVVLKRHPKSDLARFAT